MTLEIRVLPARRYAYLEHRGAYPEIGRTFGRFASLAGPVGLFVGVYLDDPSVVAPEDLRSHAGALVPEGHALPDGLSEGTLPGGRHAVGVHEGPFDGMMESWNATFAALHAEGLAPGGIPYEVYLNDHDDTAPEDLRIEIHVPLAAQSGA